MDDKKKEMPGDVDREPRRNEMRCIGCDRIYPRPAKLPAGAEYRCLGCGEIPNVEAYAKEKAELESLGDAVTVEQKLRLGWLNVRIGAAAEAKAFRDLKAERESSKK